MTDQEDAQVKIGILGGTGSGKTTFFGALQIAALLSNGNWKIIGQDHIHPGSTAALNSIAQNLLDGDFPESTQNPTPTFYSYLVQGVLSHDFFQSSQKDSSNRWIIDMWKKYTTLSRDVSFILKTYDYPGGVLPNVEDPEDPYWEYFSKCDGFIYLFDPTNPSGGFRDLHTALQFVWQRCASLSKLDDQFLPQYISVCISKFDKKEVLSKLEQNGLMQIKNNVPFVEEPQEAFRVLSNRLTYKLITSFFSPNRTSYYTTSSVGFNPTNEGFVHNVQQNGNNFQVLDVNPINVLEPLIWLEDSIKK